VSPIRLWSELLVVAAIAGCGLLPPDSPATPPPKHVAPDPDVIELAHAWKIADHILASTTEMSDHDAAELTGRTVEIRETSYKSPWQGSCEDAGRSKRSRVLADVAAELDVPRAAAVKFGLGDKLVEYRMSCNGTTRTPPLTLFVAGSHAMTCFAGVCYLMTR
jgi:hypothetical protein